MPFEFGDVVLVPFPFTSQRTSKKRPAVVVSNRAYSTTRHKPGLNHESLSINYLLSRIRSRYS
jgi:hypothetical protein